VARTLHDGARAMADVPLPRLVEMAELSPFGRIDLVNKLKQAATAPISALAIVCVAVAVARAAALSRSITNEKSPLGDPK